MEAIIEVFTSLWESLGLYTIPIINVTFQQFFLGLLMLELLITAFNILIGKESKGNDKD